MLNTDNNIDLLFKDLTSMVMEFNKIDGQVKDLKIAMYKRLEEAIREEVIVGHTMPQIVRPWDDYNPADKIQWYWSRIFMTKKKRKHEYDRYFRASHILGSGLSLPKFLDPNPKKVIVSRLEVMPMYRSSPEEFRIEFYED